MVEVMVVAVTEIGSGRVSGGSKVAVRACRKQWRVQTVWWE